MTDTERSDIVELLDDRYDKSSTILTTQMPMKTWHEAIVGPTIADSCDRVSSTTVTSYPDTTRPCAVRADS